jgi:acyl carrier protein
MQDEAIVELVINYLVKDFEIPEDLIQLEANLFKDLGLDSVDALDWFAAMEFEIKLAVVEKELKEIRTVRDVVEYVKRNQPHNA